jgi:hypothetical protein
MKTKSILGVSLLPMLPARPGAPDDHGGSGASSGTAPSP